MGKHRQTPYVYNGRKNQTDFEFFVELCKASQKELKKFLGNYMIANGYDDVYEGDGFIYARGTLPVLLTAHMDTVHKELVKDYYEERVDGKHILRSPQGIGGDDRCGIYMILELIKTHKCSVLFCEDEEIGGVGSDKFILTSLFDELKEMKYMIELDRANENDAVFYDCDNPEFTKFIIDNTDLKEAWGSFSDISNLAPAAKVAAVNISCGYYHAHTTGEEVVVEEMLHNIEVVRKLLDVECEQFEYVEAKSYYGYSYRGYSGWYDDWNGYYSGSSSSKSKSTEEVGIEIIFNDIDDKGNTTTKSDYYEGVTYYDCLGQFFDEHPYLCMNDVLDYDIYGI